MSHPTQRKSQPGTLIASSEFAARINLLCVKRGVERAAADLGIAREAIVRIVARLPVRAGTLALARERLAALDTTTAPTGGSTAVDGQ
jgi:hypothetical protein